MKYYQIEIEGLKRDLPICRISDKLSIAGFIMFGDVELTIATAKALIEKSPKFDVILTPEAKSIPLAYEMSRQTGKPYIVARKGPKLYMISPKAFEVKSITTATDQELVLGRAEFDLIKGKRVILLDDVISTGNTLTTLEEMVEYASGEIVAKCAVFAEGDAQGREDLTYLQDLPLIEG